MSWNDRLYIYAQDRGGEYFGGVQDHWASEDAGSDSVLLLEHKGAPMLVKCRMRSGKYSSAYTAQVALRCQLEREYALSVSGKGIVQKGLNTVLGGLNAGGNRDYGFPEVYASRKIKTNDPDFTKMVLRDLELRNALQVSDRFQLLVKRSAPSCAESDLQHTIMARCEMGNGMDSLEEAWDTRDGDDYDFSPERQLAMLRTGNFTEKLDALIALAKAVHGAVTAWRMPVK